MSDVKTGYFLTSQTTKPIALYHQDAILVGPRTFLEALVHKVLAFEVIREFVAAYLSQSIVHLVVVEGSPLGLLGATVLRQAEPPNAASVGNIVSSLDLIAIYLNILELASMAAFLQLSDAPAMGNLVQTVSVFQIETGITLPNKNEFSLFYKSKKTPDRDA